MKAAVLLLALLPVAATAKDKKPALEWKQGTLIDQSADESRCRSNMKVEDGEGALVTSCVTLTRYKIDAGDFIYIGQRDMWLRGDKHLNVTVNGHVEYAIRGGTLFLKDADGKPHELDLVQTLAKTAASK